METKKQIINDMIFIQDLIKNNKEYIKLDIKKMYSMKQLSQDEYRIFILRHGMSNDNKEHMFSELALKFEKSIEETLSIYKNALNKVRINIRQSLLNKNLITFQT